MKFVVAGMVAALLMTMNPVQAQATTYTDEQCQAKREALDDYVMLVHEMIRSQFASGSRYRFATKRRLEKLVWEKEVQFGYDCPNYVRQ